MEATVDVFKDRLMKMNITDLEDIVEQQGVLKEKATVKTWSTRGPIWGLASTNHRVLLTAKEMEPGQWWVLEEIGCHP